MCGRLPARRRNLLDQPQRLGFLPTYWFWNDRERQRLLLPLMTLNALLVNPPLFLLVVYFELPMWLLLIMITLWPQLLMGLVERRVRAELHRRERDGVARQPPLLRAERDASSRLHRAPLSHTRCDASVRVKHGAAAPVSRGERDST